MKVTNMKNDNGKSIPNQFIITDNETTPRVEIFQSYESKIVKIEWFDYDTKKVFLDERYWDYSNTTSKYRNKFLKETTKEIEAKINNGTYILTNLN